MTITEKVAYLKGLAEGLSLDETKPESKLIKAMLDVLDDMAYSISDLEEEVESLNDYIEEIDEDLGDVEEFLFDDDSDDEDLDEDFAEVECPHCGEQIFVDDSIDPNDVICPNCNEHFDCVCDFCDLDSCDGCGDKTEA